MITLSPKNLTNKPFMLLSTDDDGCIKPTRKELELAMKDFLDNGGTITQLPPHDPTDEELFSGYAHHRSFNAIYNQLVREEICEQLSTMGI